MEEASERKMTQVLSGVKRDRLEVIRAQRTWSEKLGDQQAQGGRNH